MDAGRMLPSSSVSDWISPTIPIRKGVSAYDGSEPSRAAPSPDYLTSIGKGFGTYWFKSPSMTSPIQMYLNPNMVDDKSWVRVFSSSYAGASTLNLIGNNIDFRGLCVQTNNVSLRGYGYLPSNALYNSRNDSTVTTSGTRTGFRIFLGAAGGHGIYTTNQNPCSWGNSNLNAIGAGWDGSTCGTFPDGLRWGTGNNSTPTYDNRSGTWEHWIWWPTP
jgi:hypothetical protein